MTRSEVLPTRLGRYQIERELGRGAMGVVYLARDPLIGRAVAVKTFASGAFASEVERRLAHRRFIREAESAGGLAHPNIVTLYDIVDQEPDGESFLAMEYVEGPNVATWMRRGEPIGFVEIAEIIAQAAAGLDYAHRRGVVHRDIKPSNLLLAAGLQVKIADFGVAKLAGSDLTHEPEVFGTPNYMPPEVMEGHAPDFRSDIYALGVVAYELLTGSPPFAAPTVAGVVLRVVRGELAPPEQLVPEIPPGTGEVLARSLHRDPSQRYGAAEDFARDLRTVLLRDRLSPGRVTYRPVQQPGWTHGPTLLLTRSRARALRRRVGRFAGRWLALAAALSLTAAAGYVGLRAAARPTTSEPGEHARLQYRETVRAGVNLMGRGDPAAAAVQFARAQALFPRGSGASALRAEAEGAARAAELERRAEVVRAALGEGRDADALSALGQLLELAPPEELTRELLLAVQRGLRQGAGQPSQSGRSAHLARTAPDAAPDAVPALPWTAVSIVFESPFEDGTLMIYKGDKQILRMRFAELRKTRGRDMPTLVRAFPAERTLFRIYTALDHRPARLTTLNADLRAGGTVRLRIVQSPADSLSARLE